jgi:beta-lactamase regulating signal transducer with metallopeptidase domain
MTPLALALNSALLHLVWQGAVVAFLLWITLAVLRNRPAQTRYVVSCGALSVLALAPVVTMYLVYQRPSRVTGTSAVFAIAAFASPISSPTNWLAIAHAWLLPAWACGVALLSMRLLWGYTKVSRLRRTGDPADSAVLATVARLSERIGITRTARVLISSLPDACPCVVGWLKPVILLPASTLLGLTTDQLEGILAHELAHIRRYDYLINIVQMLIETLFFYHPAVWWISSRIRQERELCCDDIAVRCCGDAVRYARALTALERIRVMTPSFALGVKDGPLMYRIQRLLGPVPRQNGPSRVPGIVAILLAVFCFSTDMNPVKAQAPLPNPPAPPSAPSISQAPQPQLARTLIQVTQADQPTPLPNPQAIPSMRIEHSLDGKDRVVFSTYAQNVPIPTASSTDPGAVTVELTIDQNGEVSDARVISGPMGERRSALLTALQTRFPAESASTTRQMEIYSPYTPGALPNGVMRVLTPVVAQQRLTAANERLDKLTAQQREASARGAAQLQEVIDSLKQGLDKLRQEASGQNPLAGKTLENILITGVQVSYSARDELRAKLPVSLHDVLTEDNMAATLSAVKAVYPYADAYFGTTGSGQAGFLVTVPVR